MNFGIVETATAGTPIEAASLVKLIAGSLNSIPTYRPVCAADPSAAAARCFNIR